MSLENLGRQLRRRQRERRGEETRTDPANPAEASVPPGTEEKEGERSLAATSTLFDPERSDASPTVDLQVLDPAAAARLQELKSTHPKVGVRLEALDPEQIAAVLSEDAATLVEAQVGSGKTRVLIEAILVAHQVDGVALEDMAVLTFTRKAAGEIGERLCSALGRSPSDEELRGFGTFHAVARNALEASGRLDVVERTSGFRILDSGSRRAMLRRIVAEEKLRVCYPNRLERRIAAAVEGKIRFGSMKQDDDVLRLVELFEEEKRRANVFDFDDLLSAVLAVGPLVEDSERPRRIFVDELQDSSADQLAMISALAGTQTRHFAVGDPRQVIYSWRGGVRDVFGVYRERFGARSRDLVRNHRCRAPILAVAAAVLGAGAGRMRAARRGGQRVVVRKHHDELAEAHYLAGRCRELGADKEAWDRLAILVRTREQIASLAPALRSAGLTLRTPETEGRPTEDWFAWFADLLRAVLAQDDEAAKRLDRDSKRGRRRGDVGWAGSAELAQLRERTPAPGGEWIRALALEQRLRPTRSAFPLELEATRLALAALADAGNGPSDWETKRQALERRGAWDELLRNAIGPRRDRASVRLMTMHAAKGLEFDHVFLSGINEGVLPLAGAGSAEARLEERRLLFVALTRARDSAEISWRGRAPLPRAEDAPSSFLDLIPEALLDRRDRNARRGHKRAPAPPRAAASLSPETDNVDQGTRGRGGESPSPWREGLRVRHREYGDGVIESVAEKRIVCRFGRLGRKTFSEFFCPLEIIEETSP